MHCLALRVGAGVQEWVPCSVQKRALEGGPHQGKAPAMPRSVSGIFRREFQAFFSSQGDEQRLYEFIVRHFLACCSQDAQGQETTVEIDISQERFVAHGLVILARNYLDVYPYDRWSDKVITHRSSQRSQSMSQPGFRDKGATVFPALGPLHGRGVSLGLGAVFGLSAMED